MKIRIWKFITDGGDGEHHTSIYASREAGLKAENIEDTGDSVLFDEYNYPIEISSEVLDITDFEVVE